MEPIAELPEPPYTAVIFSNIRTDGDQGYLAMGARMQELATVQPGYRGYESARDEAGSGITVSSWTDDGAARAWKQVHEHTVAQQPSSTAARRGTPTTRYGSRP